MWQSVPSAGSQPTVNTRQQFLWAHPRRALTRRAWPEHQDGQVARPPGGQTARIKDLPYRPCVRTSQESRYNYRVAYRHLRRGQVLEHVPRGPARPGPSYIVNPQEPQALPPGGSSARAQSDSTIAGAADLGDDLELDRSMRVPSCRLVGPGRGRRAPSRVFQKRSTLFVSETSSAAPLTIWIRIPNQSWSSSR